MLRVLTLLRLKVQGLRLCMTLGGGEFGVEGKAAKVWHLRL